MSVIEDTKGLGVTVRDFCSGSERKPATEILGLSISIVRNIFHSKEVFFISLSAQFFDNTRPPARQANIKTTWFLY